MRDYKQRLLLLTLMAGLLSACAAGNSEPACDCPRMFKYDRDFQKNPIIDIAAMNAKDRPFSVLQDCPLARPQFTISL